ncbi:MAG: hypothetical protein JKX73_04250 [Flavobacteriales bacterium]|nr:hypothetical protein [Flavobacteriales bacterium]
MLLTVSTIAQKKVLLEDLANPFECCLEYDTVMAYAFNGQAGNREQAIVDTLGGFAKTIEKPGQQLSKKEIIQLDKILGDTASYGGTTAACFVPRLGIIYYYKGKVVGHINICLECNYLESNPEMPLTSYYKTDVGSTTIPAKGFSKTARKKLDTLCKQLNLGYCLDNYDSIFD